MSAKNESKKASAAGTGVVRKSWRDLKFKDWVDHETDDDNCHSRSRESNPNSAFNERMRRLVGAPVRAKVTVTEEFQNVNVYGCDTWESSESIEVTVGDKTHTYDGVPELFTRLEYVDYSKDLEALKGKYLSRLGTFHFLGHDGQLVLVEGRFGNANSRQILIVVSGEDKGYRKVKRQNEYLTSAGEMQVWVYGSNFLAFDVDDTKYWCGNCEQLVPIVGEVPTRFLCPPCVEENTCTNCNEIAYYMTEKVCRTCRKAAEN